MNSIDRDNPMRLTVEPRERRGSARYPLALEIRYSVARGETGAGQIIDISRTGLRFAAQGHHERGRRLEIAINWPVLLEGRVPLQLTVAGKVVWSSRTEVAVQIYRHSFKTRSMGTTAASSQGSDGQSAAGFRAVSAHAGGGGGTLLDK